MTSYDDLISPCNCERCRERRRQRRNPLRRLTGIDAELNHCDHCDSYKQRHRGAACLPPLPADCGAPDCSCPIGISDCAAPSCTIPTSSGQCHCEHCQRHTSGVIEDHNVWSTVEVPPVSENADADISDVVPAPRPLDDDEPPTELKPERPAELQAEPLPELQPKPQRLEAPSEAGEAMPGPKEFSPMDDEVIEPISYRLPSGAHKAGSDVTAAVFLLPDSVSSKGSVKENDAEERVLLPATRISRRRIQ